MSDPRKQKPHLFLDSLNERERTFYVEKVNRGNEVLFERLKATKAVINKDKLEEDFQRHKKLGEYMKRKTRFRLPKMSPVRTTTGSELFDSSAYASLHSPGGTEDGAGSTLSGLGPIQSMSDFRKNVLSLKRAPNLNVPRESTLSRSQSQNGRKTDSSADDVKFELTHEPRRDTSGV
jgi:hypothetical protein